MRSFNYLFVFVILLIYSCKPSKIEVFRPEKHNFDTIVDGKSISLFTLKNKQGIEVYLTNYGARIVSLLTPDKHGQLADIVLGFKTIDEYLNDHGYHGCVVGRYANRIGSQPFNIADNEYFLSANEKPVLHGGKNGFDKKTWIARQDSNTVTMTYFSVDGEERYPGNLQVSIIYTLNDNNELSIEYTATTDKATIINLSNHSYFNLKGEGDTTILDHSILINAEYFTPIDSILLPTGELLPVINTPFDFTKEILLGSRIDSPNEQLTFGLGYDHNWVLKKDSSKQSLAIKVSEKKSGRTMNIFTSKPGLQLYSGNFMKGNLSGKSGRKYQFRSALVIEPQHFPDSPHHLSFPNTQLFPNEKYYHKDIYSFGIEK